MAKLLSDFCCILVKEPTALAIVLFLLFGAIGGTFMLGMNGRRRLWDKKVDKDVFTTATEDLKTMMARLEVRVWQLGTKEKQQPPSKDIMDLANNSAK